MRTQGACVNSYLICETIRASRFKYNMRTSVVCRDLVCVMCVRHKAFAHNFPDDISIHACTEIRVHLILGARYAIVSLNVCGHYSQHLCCVSIRISIHILLHTHDVYDTTYTYVVTCSTKCVANSTQHHAHAQYRMRIYAYNGIARAVFFIVLHAANRSYTTKPFAL